MTPDSNAFALIVQMLRRSIADNTSFPRTELFSEGWMLRLLLESAFSGQGGLPFPILEEARWYSEARLSSAFLARSRRDPWREGHTRADAVVGHYLFRGGTTTGLVLAPTATQFVVLEAKMASRLSPKTTTVTGFDQAARTVAAMAWTVQTSKVAVDQLQSLAFYVVAPRDRLTKPTFTQNLASAAIQEKIVRRISLYANDAQAMADLATFQSTTLPAVLARIDVRAIAWEDLLGQVAPQLRPDLEDFYRACLQHNGLTVTPTSRLT